MEILCEIRNSVACLTLNRPAALNALSLTMVEDLRRELERFGGDPAVRAVLIQGAGEKAFCAGGDIRAIYESYHSTGTMHRDFFIKEYPLDHLLRFYRKPYVAIMNGITMGGGMGIAQGSRLRIVGERTRVAMPEVAIGFFPDVGGSYFMSRLPGALGAYLALTGTHIRAADTLYAGLADYFLSPAALEQLRTELDSLAWSGQDSAACRSDLERLIGRLASDPGDPPLARPRAAIDEHFAAATVPQLFDSLRRESRPQYAQWAADTLEVLHSRSPTMLAVTLRQLRLGRAMSLADCLRMELGMVQQCLQQGDFLEGVRALIIDKDNAPHWHPARIEEVTEDSVDAIFRDPWAGTVHPLADLISHGEPA
jgi:enoyl-CoA hydratase/carnithine racemase